MRVLNLDGTLKEVRTHNVTITPLRKGRKKINEQGTVRATNINIKVLNTHKF